MCDLKAEDEEYFLRNWLRMPRREPLTWVTMSVCTLAAGTNRFRC